ncbi:MAG: allophanate hydrolase subunit 1 [Pseudomonadota bacterium]
MGLAPDILPMGITGLLVRFSDTLSPEANRAALAFRGGLEAEALPGVEEVSSALASTFLRLDPLAADIALLRSRVADLLASQDWSEADLPPGRTLWRIPCAWGGAHGPDLAEVAAQAGLSETAAIDELSTARVRVLALGFAPGQPYLGALPSRWDIPRRSELNPRIPGGALGLAVRQFVLFAKTSPTGWSHVGQTAFRPFAPQSDTPIPLSPSDEVELVGVDAARIESLIASDDPLGGATSEVIA